MNDALQLLELSDLIWPLSYRYHLAGPWGGSQVELHVDAPSLWDQAEASAKLGGLLWNNAIAHAISLNVDVVFIERVVWKSSPLPIIGAADGLQGMHPSRTSSNRRNPCMVLHSGHHDGYALHRFTMPGAPRDWHDGSFLTLEGAEQMQTLARGWLMGMGDPVGAYDPVLLICHGRALPGPLEGTYNPGWRKVQHIRVLQHAERLQSPGNLLWP